MNDLTSSDWEQASNYYAQGHGRTAQFGHIRLADVYSYTNGQGGRVSLDNWPTGADRLLLTKCLEFAHANPSLDLDTSHFDWIIRTQGFMMPARLNSRHDMDAAARVKRNIPDPQH